MQLHSQMKGRTSALSNPGATTVGVRRVEGNTG